MAELDLNGVLTPGLLVWAAAAYLLRALISAILARAGLYRLVWHRPLFDVSVFVILWGAIAAVMFHAAFPGVELS